MAKGTTLPSVLLFDLWKTLIFSIDKDPILDVQEYLGHNRQVVHAGQPPQVVVDPRFMEICLTTNIADPERFLNHVAAHFGLTAPEEAHESFRRLLANEVGGVGSAPITISAVSTARDRSEA